MIMIMIGLCAGVLMMGIAAGFLLAKTRFQKLPSAEQQKKLVDMAAEAALINKQLSQLQQDKADLTYQLGESKRSLSYAEQQLKKQQS